MDYRQKINYDSYLFLKSQLHLDTNYSAGLFKIIGNFFAKLRKI